MALQFVSDSSVEEITHPEGCIDISKDISGLQNSPEISTKAAGIILWLMGGDTLGAPVEGKTAKEIAEKFGSVRNFKIGKHLGASEYGLRFGIYTDDTQTTLAVAKSIIENRCVDAEKIAVSQAKMALETTPKRGYPPSSEKILKILLQDPAQYKNTATLDFPEGKYSNGAAMKISPIAIIFRESSCSILKQAIKATLLSTHVHPQALDGCFAFCLFVQKLIKLPLNSNFSQQQVSQLMQNIKDQCETLEMKANIQEILDLFPDLHKVDDSDFCWKLGECLEHQFQIRCVDAVAISFYLFAKYFVDPEEALISAVSIGGDTDTLAALAGVLLGAFYGPSRFPKRWFVNLENGPCGRDYAVQLFQTLSELTDVKITL